MNNAKFLRMAAYCSFLVVLLGSCSKKSASDSSTPATEVKAPPAALGLDPFYKKYLDADGIPVISSEKVADEALIRARVIVRNMIKMIPDAKAKMIANKMRVGIIGKTERPTQMPEYRDLYTAFPGVDWDNRGRGYGATLQRPLTSNGEENLLCDITDRYKGEEILTHELAHGIHELGLRFSNPNFDSELLAAYNNAKAKGLWKNTYAISDVREYWAEGLQNWFNCNLKAIPANGIHNEINNRTGLETYDAMLYNLIKKYFTSENIKHGCM